MSYFVLQPSDFMASLNLGWSVFDLLYSRTILLLKDTKLLMY